jgi:hypothetical protein
MNRYLFTVIMIVITVGTLFAQENQIKIQSKKNSTYKSLQPIVSEAASFDISPPLSEMVVYNKLNGTTKFHEDYSEIENKFRKVPQGEYTGEGKPDMLSILQQNYNTSKAETIIMENSFDGGSNSDNTGLIMPPDTQGDVSPEYYVQAVNNVTTIFDRDGNILQGPFNTSDFWSGFPDGSGGYFDETNDGDPIILWDEEAQRWMVSQFAVPHTDGNMYELIAISQTSDPRGSYFRYAFQYQYMPDYPKFGIWTDGYYCGYNAFDGNTSMGIYVSAFERDEMLVGNPSARVVTFNDLSEFAVFPVDTDVLPANGTPCYFMSDEVATYTGNNEVYIYEFSVDWNNTSNSTWGLAQTLTVADYGFFGSDTEAQQPGTSIDLDLLHYRTMYRSYYRPFGTHNSIVMCRTVDPINSNGTSGIRWYEFRNVGTGSWSVYQQGTYDPDDGNWRWMPSIAMNAFGDIAIGYSISNNTNLYPSIAGVARYSSDPLNIMSTNEMTFFTGSASQDVGSTYTRWGDYAMMSVDPSDNYSFWYTQQYTAGGWNWKTRVIHFSLPSLTPPTVSNVTPTSLFEDRGKKLTITGSNLNGSSFILGGITGVTSSNNGTTAEVIFPSGNYSNNDLVVINSGGSITDNSVIINTRNLIPVISGSTDTEDSHPTIQSAVDGLFAWYGTTSFDSGDNPGSKTIDVYEGTYIEGITLNNGLNPTSSEKLIIQNHSGDNVIIDATANNFGFYLSTVNFIDLKGFTIHSANLDNIYAQGDYISISYNQTYGSISGSGIKVETGTPFTIINNLSYNNYKYGIENLSANSIIKNNTADNNGGSFTPAVNYQVFYDDIEPDASNWSGTGTWYTFNTSNPDFYVSPTNIMGTNDFSDIYISKTDPVDISNFKEISLSFYVRSYIAASSQRDNNFEASYSFDGTNWTTFETLTSASPGINSFAKYTVSNLDNAGTENNLYIRFRCDINRRNIFDDVSDEYWMIDDIEVIGNEKGTAFQSGAAIYIDNVSTILENNIFAAKQGNDNYYALISPGNQINSNYNTYYTTNTNLFDYNGSLGNDGPMQANDISSDPLFVGSGDYHLQSAFDSYHGGEWPPFTSNSGSWTTDASNSPGIDAGNPC